MYSYFWTASGFNPPQIHSVFWLVSPWAMHPRNALPGSTPNWVPWPTSKGSLEAEELDALNVMDLVHAAQLFGQILLRNIGHTWVATVGTQESTVAGDFLAFFWCSPKNVQFSVGFDCSRSPFGSHIRVVIFRRMGLIKKDLTCCVPKLGARYQDGSHPKENN